MKKILSMLLAFTIACTNFSGVSNFNPIGIGAEVVEANSGVATIAAGDEFVSGDYTYKVTSDTAERVTVISYNKDGVDLEIPSTVNSPAGYYTADDNKFVAAKDDNNDPYANDKDYVYRPSGITYTVTSVSADGGSIFSGLSDGAKKNIETIVIPNKVETIGESAFAGCPSLENITLPASLKTLGATPFTGCTSLKTVTFSGDAPTVSGSSTIDSILGQSATVKYSSDSSINPNWKTFITTVTADNDSEYVNSKATTLSPTITSTGTLSKPQIGDTLTVSVTDYPIQWYADGVEISGATSEDFKITSAEDKKTISVKVSVPKNDYTYLKGDYTATTSTGVWDGKVVLPALSFSPDSIKVGDTVELVSDADLTDTNLTIKWYNSNSSTTAIQNGGTSYTLISSDFDTTITAIVTVTAGHSDYNAGDYTITSGKVAQLDGLTLSLSTKAPTVNSPLTLSGIPSDLEDGTYTISWSDGTNDLGSSDSNTLSIGTDLIGKIIKATVVVTGSNNYENGTYEIETETAVPKLTLPTPTIDPSSPKFGQTLAITNIPDDLTSNYSIAWYVGGVEIDGSTADTLKIESSYATKKIYATITVDADNPIYVANEYKSNETAEVSYADVNVTIEVTDGSSSTVVGKPESGDELSVIVVDGDGETIDESNYSVVWTIGDNIFRDYTKSLDDGDIGSLATATVTIAENKGYTAGEYTNSVTVLKDLPKVQLTSDSQFRVGSTLTLSFVDDTTINTNDYYISWYRDGQEFSNNNLTLYLEEATYKNKVIKVVVKDKYNNVYNAGEQYYETSAILAPQLPTPTITITDEDGEPTGDALDTMKVGQYVTVSVEDNGTAIDLTTDYKIQWYKGNVEPKIVSNSKYALEEIDGATSATYQLDDDDEDYYMIVYVTPTDAVTDYSNEPIPSAWTESTVADASGKKYLSGLTIAYNSDGTSLVITSPSGVDFTSGYSFKWFRIKDGVLVETPVSTSSSLTLKDTWGGSSFYVEITPDDDNLYYKNTPATSNEITILPFLPDFTIALNEEKLTTFPYGSDLVAGDVLTVSIDKIDDLSGFLVEWVVDDVAVQSSTAGDDDALSFTIKDAYSGGEISVRITNKTSSEYNNIAKSSDVIGSVETKVYDITYDLKLLTTTDPDFDSLPTTLEYNDPLEFTFVLDTDNDSKFSLPTQKSDISVKMGGSKYTGFSYDSMTGKFSISKVTGDVVIEATAYTKDAESGTNLPTIYINDKATGITSTKYTLSDSDKGVSGWYEFYLEAVSYDDITVGEGDDAVTTETRVEGTLPDKIEVNFTAAVVTMSLTDDGYGYDPDSGKILINPDRFGSSLGYIAEITCYWLDGTDYTLTSPNKEASETVYYTVTINSSSSDDSIKTTEEIIENVSYGDIISTSITVNSSLYKTPVTLNSIYMDGTKLSENDYSFNGTTVTFRAGLITKDCTIKIDSVATGSWIVDYDMKYYIGENISLTKYVESVLTGGSCEIELTADDDYSLPSYIQVYTGDAYEDWEAHSNYSYNSSTGIIKISEVKNHIFIIVPDAIAKTYHTVTHALSTGVTFVSGDAPGTNAISTGETYTAVFGVTDSTNYYALTSDEVYVYIDDVITSNYTFNEATGQLTIPSVSGDVKISISAIAIPSSHTAYFNLSYLYSDVLTEDNQYTLTLSNGETKTIYLKVRSDYVDSKFLPASITVYNTRTEETLVAGTDYTWTVSDSYGTLIIKTISDSLRITAIAVSEEPDYDADSDSDSDSDSNGGGSSGDSDSDSDSSTSSTYDITFVDTSGNTVTTLTTSTSKVLSYLPTITTSNGTVFLGWYTSSSGGTKVTTSTVFSSDTKVYARTYSVFTPVYNSDGDYTITTSSSNISIYADSLKGGTITVNSNYVGNFVIVSPYDGYKTTASTMINLPDSNGNTVSWTIPAGVEISSTNHLNLAISVSEYAITTDTSLGRSLGYVDFAHSGALTANNQTLYVTFRNYQVSVGDTPHLFKLNDYNEMTGDYVSATAIGNYYIRAGMTSCSRWEIIARNYSYNPDNGGYYIQYFNIPTTGYIEELRNVQLNQVLDLTKINLGNGIIIEGWYYDQSFTNKVTNPSYVVVTEAIIKTGLYPRTYTDYVTPETGNPWPDAGNNYKPNLSDTPETNTFELNQLF